LSKKERREQDKERLAIEAEFESTIVKEVALLRQYQPSI
jgi:hypothetical protein